jgi:hypothetical protein
MHPLDDVYSGLAGEYSAAMSRVTEPPRSFYYFAFLTSLGSVMSGRITLASAIAPQPRLYTILLGESADTRKSTAINITLRFFIDALADFGLCRGAGSAEGLCEQFKRNSRILLVYDEARRFVSKCKIEASVLLEAVNSLFELNDYQSVTKKHTIDITDAHLSILGASTPETYSSMFNSQFLDIGFVNRLFVVQDQGRKMWSIPPKLDLNEKGRLKQHLADLLRLVTEAAQGDAVEMGLTAEAGERWDDYYHEEMPEGISAKRLDAYGLRFMPLLGLNEGRTEVDLRIVEKVITILKWEYETRKMVDPISADSRIAEMEQKIRRYTDGGITKRDLMKKVHYERYGVFIFNAALRNLLKVRDIKFESKTGQYYLLS